MIYLVRESAKKSNRKTAMKKIVFKTTNKEEAIDFIEKKMKENKRSKNYLYTIFSWSTNLSNEN